jgi:tetratricopeptide (TPR) repeat protein
LLQRLSDAARSAESQDAARTLRQIQAALRGRALDEALRNLDRAWRHQSDNAAVWAPIYGGLMALEARDHDAALRLLQRALEFAPDPDISALAALTLLRLHRAEEARRQLETTLTNYCVSPVS